MVAEEHPRVLRTGKKETPVKLQIKSRREKFGPGEMREAPAWVSEIPRLGVKRCTIRVRGLRTNIATYTKAVGPTFVEVDTTRTLLSFLGLGSAPKGLGSSRLFWALFLVRISNFYLMDYTISAQ
ncbi:hypothetical protein TorRG33x02_229970 [Trema orientale]|uniref:Uncharacterized protein n=1 Tax=Trema orientale TaxID=63057 RepID=A0A2P5E6T0_TREOI|nr:hypothetical protein TorRG33x02_229970 [Trema orientale]